jgi:hypothetical protein
MGEGRYEDLMVRKVHLFHLPDFQSHFLFLKIDALKKKMTNYFSTVQPSVIALDIPFVLDW